MNRTIKLPGKKL